MPSADPATVQTKEHFSIFCSNKLSLTSLEKTP